MTTGRGLAVSLRAWLGRAIGSLALRAMRWGDRIAGSPAVTERVVELLEGAMLAETAAWMARAVKAEAKLNAPALPPSQFELEVAVRQLAYQASVGANGSKSV